MKTLKKLAKFLKKIIEIWDYEVDYKILVDTQGNDYMELIIHKKLD